MSDLEIDWTDVPPPGTGCVPCAASFPGVKGHFCPAKGYLDGDPICRACAANETCDQSLAVARVFDGMGYDEMEVDRAPDPGRSVPLELASPPAEDRLAAAMSAWPIKGELREENLRRTKPKKPKPKKQERPELRRCACGSVLSRQARGERCGPCIRGTKTTDEVQPKARSKMEKVLCAGGCGRSVPPSTLKAGGRYAVGCRIAGCKDSNRVGRPAAAPKLVGVDGTIAYLRKQLGDSEALVESRQILVDSYNAEIVRESAHQVVLRETLNKLDPPTVEEMEDLPEAMPIEIDEAA